jgi:hypothetical protein
MLAPRDAAERTDCATGPRRRKSAEMFETVQGFSKLWMNIPAMVANEHKRRT